MIDKIKKTFKDIGEVYSIFNKNDQYAVKLNDNSETLYVFDELIDSMDLISLYDPKGQDILENWECIYEQPGFDEENEEENVK